VDKTVFIDSLHAGAFMRAQRYTCLAGGKGTNVSRAVHALGRPTRAMVVVGGHTGRHVVDMIAHEDGIDCVPAWVDSPTRTITTVLEETIHRQTALFEPGSRVTGAEAKEIVDTFRGAIVGASVVALCGTVSDPAIRNLYVELISIAHEAGVLTILDSHGPEFAEGIAAKPYMIKPNVPELEEWIGHGVGSIAERWCAIDRAHEQGIELIVLSMGKEGAMVSRGDNRFRVLPPEIDEVNPVGSGDALVAGFAIGLMENVTLEEMAILGCAAGAANAMTWEIGRFTRKQVEMLVPRVRIERA
jgi:tagatose 6-phosphate kinase